MLGVNGSGLYYAPVGESEENLRLMRWLDEQYTRTPFYGSRKMTESRLVRLLASGALGSKHAFQSMRCALAQRPPRTIPKYRAARAATSATGSTISS